jgi:hypothetical protein
MKTLLLKVDLVTGLCITDDLGVLTWDEAKVAMRDAQAELRFYRKRPLKPRAVRTGDIRLIVAPFMEEK